MLQYHRLWSDHPSSRSLSSSMSSSSSAESKRLELFLESTDMVSSSSAELMVMAVDCVTLAAPSSSSSVWHRSTTLSMPFDERRTGDDGRGGEEAATLLLIALGLGLPPLRCIGVRRKPRERLGPRRGGGRGRVAKVARSSAAPRPGLYCTGGPPLIVAASRKGGLYSVGPTLWGMYTGIRTRCVRRFL